MKLLKNIKVKNTHLLLILIFCYSITRDIVTFFFVNSFSSVHLISSFFINTVIVFFPLIIFRLKIKWYFLLVFLIMSISNFIDFVHLFQYKVPVSMGVFAVIAETTSQEVMEFFNIIPAYGWLLSFFLSFYIIFGLFFIQKAKRIERKIIFKILIISLVSAFLILGINNYVKFGNYKISRDITFLQSNLYQDAKRIGYYLREKRKLSKIVEERKNFKFKLKKDTLNNNKIFVLIIGESMAKNHLSLYGYQRETTPKLKKIDSLLIFNDVISSATRTTASIVRMLSMANVKSKEDFYHKGSLLSLLKSAGYKTYWISNQQMLGISDTEVSSIANEADITFFLNTDWHTNSLDEKVLPKLNNVLLDSVNKKFIVIHLLGNHFSYDKRYPHTKKFILTDNYNYPKYLSMAQIENWKQYDNSILYSDFIISSIINRIKKENVNSSILYLSDHGEEMYDDENKVTGHGRSYVKKQVVEIPFLLWNSQQYYVKENKYSKFISFQNRKFSSEDLFFSIADLLNIKFNYEDLTKSVFSEEFLSRKRFIINSNQEKISYEDVKKN